MCRTRFKLCYSCPKAHNLIDYKFYILCSMKIKVPVQHIIVYPRKNACIWTCFPFLYCSILCIQELDPCTGEPKQVEREKPISSESAIIGTSCYLPQSEPQKYSAPPMQDRVSVWHEPNTSIKVYSNCLPTWKNTWWSSIEFGVSGIYIGSYRVNYIYTKLK
jgi:hypothetical protein